MNKGKLIIVKNENSYSPYITLWESREKFLAIQTQNIECNEEDFKDNLVYANWTKEVFSNEPDLYEIGKKDGLGFAAKTDLNLVYVFNKTGLNLEKYESALDRKVYKEIVKKLAKKNFDNKEAMEMIQAALNNL